MAATGPMLEYTVPRAAVGTRGDLLVGELPASPDIAWKRDFEGREGCLGLTGDARQRLEHGSGATEPIVPGYMRFIPANGPGASLGRFADMAETSLAVKKGGGRYHRATNPIPTICALNLLRWTGSASIPPATMSCPEASMAARKPMSFPSAIVGPERRAGKRGLCPDQSAPSAPCVLRSSLQRPV